VTVTVIPEPGPERLRFVDTRLELARRALADGDRERAVETLVESVQAGLWSHSRLWSALLSSMEQPADYAPIRTLWLESPRRCHRDRAIVRVVARAATAAGEHDEARTLLRKAILRESQRQRRLRVKLQRYGRWAGDRLARLPLLGGDRAATARRSEALADLGTALGELGVRPFLVAETLLDHTSGRPPAATRSRIQLGTFSAELSAAELRAALGRSPTFGLHRHDLRTSQLRVRHPNAVAIDLNPHHRSDDGRVWHEDLAARWWHTDFRLASTELAGVPCLTPEPAQRYLDERYGDWRTVAAGFDPRLDAPNVEVTDPERFTTLLYFSLLASLASRQRDRASRYRQLLTEHGEGSWLDRLRIAATAG
jgi:hypothetical protein